MTENHEQTPEFHVREINRFATRLGLAAALLAAIPAILGYVTAAPGQQYLPFHLSLDDHMVYAAWMRQAMEGQVLFDNRFTTDAQPGLTIQLFFLALGLVAKLVGIPLTLTVARIGLSFLSVRMLGAFIGRCGLKSFSGKFALVTSVFGAGFAFLNWHTFGDAYTRGPAWLTSLLQGRQPIDNWQPEAFVFPSMLTNALFLSALCLILWSLNCVLDARGSWKPVLPGVLAFGLLMNIHSYDVALITMVLVAFLATLVGSRQFEGRWAARTFVIGLGALPAAAWFLHVLSRDPVFQARAETLTYTGGFREILVGVFPLLALSLLALLRSDLDPKRRYAGAAMMLGLTVVLTAVTSSGQEGFALSMPAWGALFALAIATAVVVARKDLGWNLLWSWAMVSLVAPYFPALFQRKLSMLLAVPWAILGAIGLARELQRMERSPRNLVAAIALAVVCLTSVFWLRRDLELRSLDVSKTLQHNLTLTPDETRVVQLLSATAYGKGVIALPGVPDTQGAGPAFFTDLSPVLSGLAGVYTYAGHWSETPEYAKRRAQVTDFYLQSFTDEQRLQMLADWKVEYVVAPNPRAYEGAFPDLSTLGETVFSGDQLYVVKVRRP